MLLAAVLSPAGRVSIHPRFVGEGNHGGTNIAACINSVLSCFNPPPLCRRGGTTKSSRVLFDGPHVLIVSIHPPALSARGTRFRIEAKLSHRLSVFQSTPALSARGTAAWYASEGHDRKVFQSTPALSARGTTLGLRRRKRLKEFQSTPRFVGEGNSSRP